MSQPDDPRVIYSDIIDLPHYEPKHHPRMSLYKRAAQFAPFAALAGYDEMVAEESRTTDVDHMRILEPDEAEELNQRIQRLMELTEAGQHPTVSMTYFEPDVRKAGGQYVTITDRVKRVDGVNRVIELDRMEEFLNKSIAIDRVSWIELED